MSRFRHLAAIVAFAPLFAACGITLSAGTDGSELFQELTIEGSFVAGQPLSLELRFTQQYPVAVAVDCDLLEDGGETKVTDILSERLQENPEGGPVGEATPIPGILRQTFPAPEQPGDYIVECFTPEDENNVISKKITVRAAPPPTATPEF